MEQSRIGEISVSASVDHAVILVGDRIALTVAVRAGAPTEVRPPDFRENKIGDFEIKDFAKEAKSGFFGSETVTYRYFVTAYSAGKHQVPAIEIKYRKKGSKDWKGAQTKPLNITVESILPKGKTLTDIRDVKGPMRYNEINLFLIAGALILLAVMAAVIAARLRKKPAPVKLPHETALEELEAIKGDLLRSSDVKGYYTAVSDCIRRYIERAFRLKAPEMTTEEFLGSLGGSRALSLDQKDLLKDFLNACDLVKFAKYTPEKGETEAAFLAAKRFVEETKGAGDARV